MDNDIPMHWLRCPDDGGLLQADAQGMRCTHCGRVFAELGERMFDARSLAPKRVDSTVQAGYEALHAEASVCAGQPPGWGNLASAPAGKRAFVQHERETITALLGDRATGLVVDVSGGVGNYSSHVARRADKVVHCELHMPSFAQACRDHGRLGNLLFLRSDYLALPLADGVADGVICTDTLIRGVTHEKALLAEIRRVLKPGGYAVVDFHHLRFKGIQKRSPLACAYSLSDFLSMVEQCGLAAGRVHGVGYIPTRAVPWEWACHPLDFLARLLVPPSRFLIRLSRQT